MDHALKPGLLHPPRHHVGREAEPAMGVLVTQEFQFVRREVHDQQPALGPQHAGCLMDGAPAVVEKVQHLMDDDDIEGVVRDREVEDVALANAAVANAGMIQPRAGEGQHLAAEIDSESALDLGAEHFKYPAGASAEVEQRTEWTVEQQGADFRLYGFVGGMKAADTVPIRGMAAKVVLGRLYPRGAYVSQPLAVAGNGWVGRIDGLNEAVGNRGGRSLPTAAEKGPRTLPEPLHQLGFHQQLEVARNPRLRLSKDFS